VAAVIDGRAPVVEVLPCDLSAAYVWLRDFIPSPRVATYRSGHHAEGSTPTPEHPSKG
jgi:hypothetical protein